MPTTILDSVHSPTTASEATRWGQLIFGIICMVMIANLQYGWTLFVNPIDQKYHWGRAAIQVAFTIFVLTETWLVPLEGYLIEDRWQFPQSNRRPGAAGGAGSSSRARVSISSA